MSGDERVFIFIAATDRNKFTVLSKGIDSIVLQITWYRLMEYLFSPFLFTSFSPKTSRIFSRACCCVEAFYFFKRSQNVFRSRKHWPCLKPLSNNDISININSAVLSRPISHHFGISDKTSATFESLSFQHLMHLVTPHEFELPN